MSVKTKIRSKNTNTITTIRPLAKMTFQDYFKFKDQQWFEHMHDFVERLCLTLHEWAQEPTSLYINQFCNDYKIPYNKLQNLFERNEKFREHYQDIKMVLGTRRKVGAITKQYHPESAYKDVHLYDPNWAKDVDKYHDDRKKEIDSQVAIKFGALVDCAKLSYAEKEALIKASKKEDGPTSTTFSG